MPPMIPGFTAGDPWEMEDEEPTFEQAVAGSLAQQYQEDPASVPAPPPPPVELPQGEAGFVPEPTTADQTYAASDYFSAPAQDFQEDPAAAMPFDPLAGLPVAPPVERGSSYFNDVTSRFDADPASVSVPTYVSNEDFFTADTLDALFQSAYDVAPPVLGDGSRWFSDVPGEREMQRDWWQSEYTDAMLRGDTQKMAELDAERDRVSQAYRNYYGFDTPEGYYKGELDRWYEQHGAATDRFLADMQAAMGFDPRGEGLLRGWVDDRITTPEAAYDPTGRIMLRSDVRRSIEQAFQESPGGPDWATLFPQQRTFEQENAQQLRRFHGDPDAEAYFSGFGPGAYGGPQTTIGVGALDAGIRGYQAGIDAVARGIASAASADVPGTSISTKDALGAGLMALALPGDYLYNDLKSGLAGLIVQGKIATRLARGDTRDFQRSLDDLRREEQWYKTRFESEHPWLDLAGSLVVDPLNVLPVGAIATAGREATRARATSVLLSEALDANELRRVQEVGLTGRDLLTVARSQQSLERTLGVRFGRSKLADAFAKRLSVNGWLTRGTGGDLQQLFFDEVSRLPELGRRVGADDAEVRRLMKLVNDRRMGRAVAETLDQTQAATLADLGRATPIPSRASRTPIEQAAARADDLDRLADEIVPTRAVESAPPLPEPAGLPTISDLIDGPEPRFVDRAKVSKKQRQTAIDLYRDGRLTDDEARALIDGTGDRAAAYKTIQTAIRRDPVQLTRDGLLRVGPDDPNYRRAVKAAQEEAEVRRAYSQHFDELLPRIGDHPSSRISRRGFMRDAEGVAGKDRRQVAGLGEVAPPGLILDALGRNVERLRQTAWRTLLPDLEAVARYTLKDGTLSSTTVGWLYDFLRDDMVDLARSGWVPLEDVHTLKAILDDAYLGSRIADEQAARRAQDLLNGLGPRAPKELERIDTLKARNLALVEQKTTALVMGNRREARRIAREIEQNTAMIRQVEPGYQVELPRVAPGARAAAQDEALRAAGIERPPTSDPEAGFATPVEDATNDVLAKTLETGAVDPAAGGGMGIVHPGAKMLYDWTTSGIERVRGRLVPPVIEPGAAAFRSLDWADTAAAKRYDEYIREAYRLDDLADSRFFSRQALKPTTLQQSAQVAKVGDIGALVVHGLLDEAYNVAHGTDPESFVLTALEALSDPATRLDDLAATPGLSAFFTNSKEGAEWLRTFRTPSPETKDRTIGQEVVARWKRGEFDPEINMGWFSDMLTVPDGTFRRADLEQLDRLLVKTNRPPGMTDDAWQRLQSLRDLVRSNWKSGRRALGYDPEKLGWSVGKEGVPLEEVNRILFPEVERKLDLVGTAENMGSYLSALEARRIGYRWEDVDPLLKMMRVVKGNLTPLWMTMVPGYHVRNVAGNVTSQLIAALRSDMHVSPLLRRGQKWAATVDRAGTGIGRHPWLREGLSGTSTADVGEIKASGEKFLIPKTIDRIPGLRQWKGGLSWVGDTTEMFAKEVVYSQEWDWRYADRWRTALERAGVDGDLKRDLLEATGLTEVLGILERRGVGGAARTQIMAAQREAIAWANVYGYQTAAKTLRDYRMRTRLDGLLDRVLPVHYWTTRNALFVGSTLVNRPQTIAQGMAVYDTWTKENEHLPFSMQIGLLPIPGRYLPFIGDDKTYYLRLKSLINPAVFAIPKLADPKRWSLDGTTLPARLESFGLRGTQNLWEALGYRVGPQWDVALRATNRLAQHLDPQRDHWVTRLATYLTEPGGYRSDLLPLGPFAEKNVAALARKTTGFDPAPYLESINQLVYGTPYSRGETARMVTSAADLWQRGEISESQFYAIVWALNEGKFDPTEEDAAAFVGLYHDASLSTEEAWQALQRVRPLVNGVQDASAIGYGLSALGISGISYGATQQGRTDAERLLDDLMRLPEHEVALLKQAILADDEFRRLKVQSGEDLAWANARENTPWVFGYWMAWDGKDEIRKRLFQNAFYNAKREDWARADAAFNAEMERQTKASPFYDRIERNNAGYDAMIQRARGNMVLIDQAERARQRANAQVYSDAAAAGVDLVGIDRLPKHGRGFYERSLADSRFLEANDAREAVDELERVQAQRGHILDLVGETLDITRRVTVMAPDGVTPMTVPNPRFVDEHGDWDEAAYQAALSSAAAQAPALYRQIAMDLATAGEDIDVRTLAGINGDDFLYHNRSKGDEGLAQWRAEKSARWQEIQGMPEGTSAERDAKHAAKEEFFAVWGDFGPAPYGQLRGEYGTYGADPQHTKEENYAYGETVGAIRAWYWERLTPAEQDALAEQYPDAFTTETKTADDGETYAARTFDPTRLTREQLDAIRREYKVPIQTPLQEGGRLFEEVDRTNTFRQLDAQFNDVLSEDEQAIIDTKFAVRRNPRWPEVEALLQTSLTKQGYPSYKIARSRALEAGDTDLAELIDAYLIARDDARPVEEKQRTWLANLPEDQRTLLVEGNPSKYAYFVDGASGGGGSSTPAQSDQNAPGAANERSTSDRSFAPRSTFSGRSGGASRTFTPRASFSSGGGGSRSFGGGSGSDQGGPSDLVRQLTSFDPLLASGQDDGRGAIVSEVGARLTRMMALWDFLPPEQSRLLTGALLGWLTRKLGDAPTLATWQSILDLLNRRGQQSEQPQPAPAAEGAPSLAVRGQRVPVRFLAGY